MAKRKKTEPPAPAAPTPAPAPITERPPLATASCWKCRRHLDCASLKQVRTPSGRDAWECSHAQLVKSCKVVTRG